MRRLKPLPTGPGPDRACLPCTMLGSGPTGRQGRDRHVRSSQEHYISAEKDASIEQCRGFVLS
jgi:hypothetical protein